MAKARTPKTKVEELAKEIYLRLFPSNVNGSFSESYVLEKAFERAEAFYNHAANRGSNNSEEDE